MPKAGTKRVEIDGKPTFLPEDEARVEVLLKDGCRIERRIKADKAKLKEIKQELITLATGHRGTKATVHLEAFSGQKATVVWSQETKVDVKKAEELIPLLGEYWGKVFQQRVKFVPAKGWRKFMNVVQVPQVERLKKAIGQALKVVEKNPSCKLFDVAE